MSKLLDGFYPQFCMDEAGDGAGGGGAGDGGDGGDGSGNDGGGGAGDGAGDGGQKAGAGAEGHWTEGMDKETVEYLAGKGLDKMTQAEAFNANLHSYRELEKKHGVGPDRLIVRPDPDDPEAMARFYSDLGRPEEATTYKAPEGEVDADFFGEMQKSFHEAGLTEGKAEILGKAYQAIAGGSLEKAEKALTLEQDAQVNDLRKDWGQDFDRRTTEAGHFAKVSGMPDEIVDMIENGKGSKTLLEWTYKMSQQIGSGETVNTQSGGHTTPTEATGQIKSLSEEISVDPARLSAYNKGKGADYEKMQKLLGMAAPAG